MNTLYKYLKIMDLLILDQNTITQINYTFLKTTRKHSVNVECG
jgi:hypothetical protein